MRTLWLVIALLNGSAVCLAQSGKLPELNFDRRSDAQYMDSLRTLGHRYCRTTERLPHTLHNDTLQLEGIRYLAIVFKQWTDDRSDSSLYYADRLVEQARLVHNQLYQVRGLMLKEYYYRVRRADYPRALTINQQASVLCAGLARSHSPLWQVQMNMGDIYRLLKDHPKALQSYRAALNLLPYNTLVSRQNQKLLMAQAVTQIGEVFELQQHVDAARVQFEEARRLTRETASQTNIAYADERLGDFYNACNQPDKATRYYEEALSVWKRLNNSLGEASVWARLAEC